VRAATVVHPQTAASGRRLARVARHSFLFRVGGLLVRACQHLAHHLSPVDGVRGIDDPLVVWLVLGGRVVWEGTQFELDRIHVHDVPAGIVQQEDGRRYDRGCWMKRAGGEQGSSSCRRMRTAKKTNGEGQLTKNKSKHTTNNMMQLVFFFSRVRKKYKQRERDGTRAMKSA